MAAPAAAAPAAEAALPAVVSPLRDPNRARGDSAARQTRFEDASVPKRAMTRRSSISERRRVKQPDSVGSTPPSAPSPDIAYKKKIAALPPPESVIVEEQGLKACYFLSDTNSQKHRREEERALSGGLQDTAEGKDGEDCRDYKTRLTDEMTRKLLVKASPFKFFVIMAKGNRNRKWNCMALNPHKCFPYRKRLGHVFLSLIGRSPLPEHCLEGVPAVLDVVLRLDSPFHRALQGHATKELEKTITIDGQTVDKVSEDEFKKGYFRDKVWEAYCEESGWQYLNLKEPKWHRNELKSNGTDWQLKDHPSGAPGTQIYGKGKFEITIGELVDLERTTRIATSSELPGLFYSEFVKFTTKDKAHQMFFDLRRSVPLIDIGNASLWPQQREELDRIWRDRFNAARAKQTELEKRRIQMLDELRSCPDESVRYQICNGLREGHAGWNLEDLDFNLDEQRVIADNAELKLTRMADPDYRKVEDQIARDFKEFVTNVLFNPQKFGFGGRARGTANFEEARLDAHSTVKMSLTELGTMVCVSSKGYFFVDGQGHGMEEELRFQQNAPGDHNQICERTPQRIVFLSSCGVDFCDPAATAAEAIKYFKKVRGDKGDTIYRGWKQGAWAGEGGFLERCKRLYRVIFRSCMAQKAKNPSMLPMGLGVFLHNVHEDDKELVKEAYFRAQWQLLCEQDWGFQNYFINPAQHGAVAKVTLKDELSKCNRADKRFLRCNIVMHGRDVKFLAVEMAKQKDKYPGPAFLNPSDTASVWLGLMGYFWECGRQSNYVGEEDFCCTSTGVLARVGISQAFGDAQRHIAAEAGVTRSPRARRGVASFSPEECTTDALQRLSEMAKTVDGVLALGRNEGGFARTLIEEALNPMKENPVLKTLQEPKNAIKLMCNLCECDASMSFRQVEYFIKGLQLSDKLPNAGIHCGPMAGSKESWNECSPLHVSARHGHLDVCVYLRMLGHPLDILNQQWMSVLDCAADVSNKHPIKATACVKLLRKAPEFNATEGLLKQRCQVLVAAIQQEQYEGHLQLGAYPPGEWTDLHWACALGQQHLVERILGMVLISRDETEDAIEGKGPWDTGLKWDKTGTRLEGNPKKDSPASAVWRLLSRYKDCPIISINGRSPTNWFSGARTTVEKMCERTSHIVLAFDTSRIGSAAAPQKRSSGSKSGSPATAQLAHPQLNAEDEDGWTALHWSIARMDINIMRLLLAAKGIRTDVSFDDSRLLARHQLWGEWQGQRKDGGNVTPLGSITLEIRPPKLTHMQLMTENKRRWSQSKGKQTGEEEFCVPTTGRMAGTGAVPQEIQVELRIRQGRRGRAKKSLQLPGLAVRAGQSKTEVEWNEKDMILQSFQSADSTRMYKPKLDRPKESKEGGKEHSAGQYTSALHICCELAGQFAGYEVMAKLLILHSERLLDVVGGAHKEKPLITALVNAPLLPYRSANMDGWRRGDVVRENEKSLITELLAEETEIPDQEVELTLTERVRRKCLLALQETIKRPLGHEADQRGWLLRLLESEPPFGEEATLHVLGLIGKRHEYLARNLLLYALHNACAVEAPDGGTAGDAKLVDKVLDLISGLDQHPQIAMWLRFGAGPNPAPQTGWFKGHRKSFASPVLGLAPLGREGTGATFSSAALSAASSSPVGPSVFSTTTTASHEGPAGSERPDMQYLTELVPNEEDLLWAEEELSQNNQCNRWLFDKAFNSLKSSFPTVRQLAKKARASARCITVGELEAALARTAGNAAVGGGTLVRQIFEKIQDMKAAAAKEQEKQAAAREPEETLAMHDVEVFEMEEAVGTLLRHTMKVSETALLIAVRHERTAVLELLLRKNNIDYGGKLLARPSQVSVKDLLKEAIAGQRWDAARRLLPGMQEEQRLRGDRCVFDELPSVTHKQITVKGADARDVGYKEPPTFKEVQFCFEHNLVPQSHYTLLIRSHTHWKQIMRQDGQSGAGRGDGTTPLRSPRSRAQTQGVFADESRRADPDQILRFLLHRGTSCCLVEFFEKKSFAINDNEKDGSDNFDWFDFGTGPRTGEIFLAICHHITQHVTQGNDGVDSRCLLQNGFKINEITFNRTDFAALHWPLHCLMLKAHPLKSEFDVDASHNMEVLQRPGQSRYNPKVTANTLEREIAQRREQALSIRKRYTELAVDVCRFINSLVGAKKPATKVCAELRQFALSVPHSCYTPQQQPGVRVAQWSNSGGMSAAKDMHSHLAATDDIGACSVNATIQEGAEGGGASQCSPVSQSPASPGLPFGEHHRGSVPGHALFPGSVSWDGGADDFCSSPSSNIHGAHERKRYQLSEFMEQGLGLYPIELAIELQAVEPLVAMLGDCDDQAAPPGMRRAGSTGGLRRKDLQLGRGRTENVIASCYRDLWFPGSDEWRSTGSGEEPATRSGAPGEVLLGLPKCHVRRPLLHRALSLLPFPVMTPYQESQRHLLDLFRVRNPELVRHERLNVAGANRDRFATCEECREPLHGRKYCLFTNRPHYNDPEVLYLRSTENGVFLSGTYKLLQGRLINGQRVWRRIDGKYCIFSGKGYWYVNNAKDGQLAAKGYIKSTHPHLNQYPLAPSEMHAWSRFVPGANQADCWQADPQIEVVESDYEAVGIPWFPPGCRHLGTGGTWQDYAGRRTQSAASDVVHAGKSFGAYTLERKREVVRILLRSIVLRDRFQHAQTGASVTRVERLQADAGPTPWSTPPGRWTDPALDGEEDSRRQERVTHDKDRISAVFDRCGLFRSAPLLLEDVHVIVRCTGFPGLDTPHFSWIVEKWKSVDELKRNASKTLSRGMGDIQKDSLAVSYEGEELPDDLVLGQLLGKDRASEDSLILVLSLSQRKNRNSTSSDRVHPGEWRDERFENWCEFPGLNPLMRHARDDQIVACEHIRSMQSAAVIKQNHWSCCGSTDEGAEGCKPRTGMGVPGIDAEVVAGRDFPGRDCDFLDFGESKRFSPRSDTRQLGRALTSASEAREEDDGADDQIEGPVHREPMWHSRKQDGVELIEAARRNWMRNKPIFGLAMLLQRAPWVLTDDELRKHIFLCIKSHPFDSGSTLDRMMQQSHSPILIERRHQWSRCFRVRDPNRTWDALPDPVLQGGSVADVRSVSLEAPGEQDLVVDNGLTVAHWAGLLADEALFRLATSRLQIPLMEREREGKVGPEKAAQPKLTQVLKYATTHYAAYSAATEVLSQIIQWKAPASGIGEKPPEGRDLINFQVPCPCHTAYPVWKHNVLRRYDSFHARPQREINLGWLQKSKIITAPNDESLNSDLRRTQPLCSSCLMALDRSRFVVVLVNHSSDQQQQEAQKLARHIFWARPTDTVRSFTKMVAEAVGVPPADIQACKLTVLETTGRGRRTVEAVLNGDFPGQLSKAPSYPVDGLDPSSQLWSHLIPARNSLLLVTVPGRGGHYDAGGASVHYGQTLPLGFTLAGSGAWGTGMERSPMLAAGGGVADDLVGTDAGQITVECDQCRELARGLVALLPPRSVLNPNEPLTTQRVGSEWVQWAELANAGNCEGGGGLLHRRVFNPVSAGDTPLSVASQFAHILVTQKLVAERADVGLRNHEGFDAHDIGVALGLRCAVQGEQTHEDDSTVHVGPPGNDPDPAPDDSIPGNVESGQDQLFGGTAATVELDHDAKYHTERQVEQLNEHPAVRKKLVGFAMRHFVKSAFHLILFTMVITALSFILTDHWIHFYTSHSLRTLITTEEWHTASVYMPPNDRGETEKPVRMFREDLQAVLELEDFHNWFEVPFRAKVLGDPRYEYIKDIPVAQGWHSKYACGQAYDAWEDPTECRIAGAWVSNQSACQALVENDPEGARLRHQTCWKDNPYELFRLVGSVRIKKFEVADSGCKLERSGDVTTPLSVLDDSFDDTYRLGMVGDWRCWGPYEGDGSLRAPQGPAADADEGWPWIVGSTDYSSKFSRVSYVLNYGESLDIHPWDEIGNGSYYDTSGPGSLDVRRHMSDGSCTNLTRLVSGLGGDQWCEDDGDEDPWVQQGTRFVVVFMVFYNPSVDRFVVGEVFFEIFAQGSITAFSKWHTVRVSMYQDLTDMWRGVLEVLFCIHLMIHVCEEVNDFRCMVQEIVSRVKREAKVQDDPEDGQEDGDEPNSGQRTCRCGCWARLCCTEYRRLEVLRICAAEFYNHLTSEWNMIDLTVISLQTLTVYLQVTIWQLQTSLRLKDKLLDPNQDVFFDEFVPLAHAVATQQRLLGFTTMLAWVKFLKSVVKVPEYGSTVNAIINTIMHQKVLIFGAVFSWILVAFFMGLFISFGMTTWSFRNLAPALLTTFRIVLGDSTQFEELEEQHIVAGPILFLLVLVFGQLVLLNLIVCVLQEVYEEAIKSAERDWSREIVDMYQYDLIMLPNQGSIFDMFSHWLKLNRCCWFQNFSEKALKRARVALAPEFGRRSQGDNCKDVGWVIVPQMEEAAAMDEIFHDKHSRRVLDKIGELQGQVADNDRKMDELRLMVARNMASFADLRQDSAKAPPK